MSLVNFPAKANAAFVEAKDFGYAVDSLKQLGK